MQTTAPALTTEITIDDRFELRQRLSAMKDEIDAQLKATNEEIKAEMIRRSLDEYAVGDQKLVLSVRPGRQTLERKELIALGVPEAMVNAATKRGDDYTQLDVRKA